MADVFCSACGSANSAAAQFCPKCGTAQASGSATGYAASQPNFAQPQQGFGQPQQGFGQPGFQQPVYGPAPKSRVTAGLFALLLGGLGVHKFYLNKVGLGVLYILFCWTFVPSVIALIEGIIYLTQDDATFSRNQGVPVSTNGW